MRIAVTGGSGKLGRHVVRRLTDDGHQVMNLDRTGDRNPGLAIVDLRDYGQVLDVLLSLDSRHTGFDAVVHLGAIPAPGIIPDAATFENNMLSTYHVFQACRRAGIKRVVYASSETVLGLPFDNDPPYIPVDEEYPARPESTYSLVKHLEEQMAIQLTRWDPELSITGLRFSNVMDAEDYERFPSFDADARERKWNLWG
ncbi:NAD-dependent epimerase/dehydratase family protein, partial [Arthrobacter sp. HMWF013]|uniref:NAD-dependent epimerase/dehydratase family protein n=1 Tax=Arthrobacter sp. HMWF013 TaxID=2056849 RepID=UPI000D3A9427